MIPHLGLGGMRCPNLLLGHDIVMLCTESLEPLALSNGGITAAGAGASAVVVPGWRVPVDMARALLLSYSVVDCV
jgi:hypothetical protein